MNQTTTTAATSQAAAADREAQFLAALVQIPADQFADVLRELADVARRHTSLND